MGNVCMRSSYKMVVTATTPVIINDDESHSIEPKVCKIIIDTNNESATTDLGEQLSTTNITEQPSSALYSFFDREEDDSTPVLNIPETTAAIQIPLGEVNDNDDENETNRAVMERNNTPTSLHLLSITEVDKQIEEKLENSKEYEVETISQIHNVGEVDCLSNISDLANSNTENEQAIEEIELFNTSAIVGPKRLDNHSKLLSSSTTAPVTSSSFLETEHLTNTDSDQIINIHHGASLRRAKTDVSPYTQADNVTTSLYDGGIFSDAQHNAIEQVENTELTYEKRNTTSSRLGSLLMRPLALSGFTQTGKQEPNRKRRRLIDDNAKITKKRCALNKYRQTGSRRKINKQRDAADQKVSRLTPRIKKEGNLSATSRMLRDPLTDTATTIAVANSPIGKSLRSCKKFSKKQPSHIIVSTALQHNITNSINTYQTQENNVKLNVNKPLSPLNDINVLESLDNSNRSSSGKAIKSSIAIPPMLLSKLPEKQFGSPLTERCNNTTMHFSDDIILKAYAPTVQRPATTREEIVEHCKDL